MVVGEEKYESLRLDHKNGQRLPERQLAQLSQKQLAQILSYEHDNNDNYKMENRNLNLLDYDLSLVDMKYVLARHQQWCHYHCMTLHLMSKNKRIKQMLRISLAQIYKLLNAMVVQRRLHY